MQIPEGQSDGLLCAADLLSYRRDATSRSVTASKIDFGDFDTKCGADFAKKKSLKKMLLCAAFSSDKNFRNAPMGPNLVRTQAIVNKTDRTDRGRSSVVYLVRCHAYYDVRERNVAVSSVPAPTALGEDNFAHLGSDEEAF